MSELQEGRGFRASVDGVEVLLVRAGDTVFAVANRCTHQGAPLDRGTVRLAGSPHTVTCPAHGSTFDLESGGVTRGPATQPLPAYEARIVEGVVEVRPKP
jgi:nitrite reductase/ring-hydroxylating ferredoxin subunit